MSISTALNYDANNDLITGFVDDGESRDEKFCDHVLVFMIRGVIKKYKQPICFSYCAGTTKTAVLKKIITLVIKKVQDTGLNVIATVCDQGATNMAAINMLIQQSKSECLRKGQEWRGGYFEINDKKIYPLYDPPHLLKGIRNNLLTKNLHFTMHGKIGVAKWQHLMMLYRRSPGYKGVHLSHKLTSQHVEPKLIPKMRVKHCAQVFSQTVGVTMGFMAECGQLPEESKDTADLIMFFDKLFDSVNGSYSNVVHGKKLRTAVTPTSPHLKFWNESLPILKSFKFVDNNKTRVVPSITSWVKTIEGFQNITKDLHKKGLHSLLLRHFNQDPIENMFGSIRSLGACNRMPSAQVFESNYKTLLVNNLSTGHSLGSNCEKDTAVRLQTLRDFISQQSTSTNDITEIHPEHMVMDVIDTEMMIRSNAPCDVERCAAAGYCSGWLVQTAKKFISKSCKLCLKTLQTENEEPFHRYIKLKEYENRHWLCYPTRASFDMFVQIEGIVNNILDNYGTKKNISEYIKLIITLNVDFGYMTCEQHKERLKAYFIKKTVRFFILNWCKSMNKLVCGKAQPMDDSKIVKSAIDHLKKYKARK